MVHRYDNVSIFLPYTAFAPMAFSYGSRPNPSFIFRCNFQKIANIILKSLILRCILISF